MFSIKNLISNNRIKILLQPIVSVKRKSILGYEVLSRGIDDNNEIISANDLFSEAKNSDTVLELDQFCRMQAITKYKDILKEKLLFLNFDVSYLNKELEKKEALKNSVKLLYDSLCLENIDSGKVVIEILEAKVRDLDELKKFIDYCKSFGFLIALDDVGSGCSNLNRISLVKPDIIKIDKYLLHNIDSDYHKQEVFKSITSLSRVLGTLVIAEGVETEAEAIHSIELRTDFIQGFFFAKPDEVFDPNIEENIGSIYNKFKEYFEEKTRKKRAKNRIVLKISKEISRELELIIYDNSVSKEAKIKNSINKFLYKYPHIECIYLIDSNGKQVSETYFDSKVPLKYNKNLFSAANKGDDHSLKQYFYQLKVSHTTHFISKTYISLATGNACRTITSFINKDLILAMDINAKKFNEIVNNI